MLAKLLTQIVLLFILANTAVYFLSDYSIFQPPEKKYTNLTNLMTLETATGKHIGVIYMPNPSAKFVILYSHGNAEDLATVRDTLLDLYNWGFSVIGYDYEGYGSSEGTPSEPATYNDIDAVYNYLVQQQKISPQNIIVFGRSLGSGPSIELAANNPVAAVILESPFLSAYRVITQIPIFLFDKYDNAAKLNQINVPLLVIHGMHDEVVPFWQGKRLYTEYRGKREYCWVEDVGHNDIEITMPQIKTAILKFVQDLPPAA